MALDFAPHDLTSYNSHPPFEVGESSAYAGVAKGHRACDSSVAADHYWIGTEGGSGWVTLYLGSGNSKILGGYSLYANSIPEPNRVPRNWTMQGSNNNSDWSVLDTVTGQTSWGSGEGRMFACDVTTTAYSYFRIVVTANNGDASYTIIGELYLWEFAGKTINGLAKANAKTINSLALGPVKTWNGV